MRRVALLLLALGCTGALPARASEESQALASRGLIELHAGHTPQALALFDKAVSADPNDAYAHYQRGATRAQLGDESGAIEDLHAALAIKPDFPPAALELGIALTDSGKYDEAEPWLVQAQQQPDLDAQASFFLGIDQLRLERYDAAQQSFTRASARDPSLDLSSQYYQGVIAYRQHDLDSAEARFTAVEQASPNAAIGHESRQFLDVLRRDRRAAYSAWGTIAFEYDSNVSLGPASTTTIPSSVSGEGDGRFVLDAGGSYVPWSSGPARLALSYEFFQTRQFTLTEFDLQDHRPAVQLTYDFGRVLVGLLGRYDYYLLSSDSFLQEVSAFPWVALREDGIGRTEVFARVQWRHYYAKNSFAILDGLYNYGGVRQVLDLGGPNQQLSFGYELGFTSPDDRGIEQYQYGSQQFDVALRWPLPYSIIGEAGYRYEYQGYAAASANLKLADGPRHDNDHRAVLSFERPLSEISEHLFVNASWFGTFNNSNNPLFQYERQIGSIGAEVRF